LWGGANCGVPGHEHDSTAAFEAKGKVQRWNFRHIHVVCPFCDEVDIIDQSLSCPVLYCRHTISEKEPATYVLSYPFDATSGLVGYSVNKHLGYYESLGARPLQERQQWDMPRRFASWEDVEKAEKASLDMLETESWVIPYCQDIEIKLLYGNGKVAEQTLRRFSNESDRFLRIQQYPSGATMLHVVACEDTSDMIPLLINYGAEVGCNKMCWRGVLVGRVDCW
jgi:hypothetical protein